MPNQVGTSQVIRFATFEVDLQAQELRKAGLRLKLSGQPFQVLAILLEQPGVVVTREELQKRLWPDTFVDVDHNLNTAINKIREVLGDAAENPRFVETLPRRGYRFIAPVEDTYISSGLASSKMPVQQRSWILRLSIPFLSILLLAAVGVFFLKRIKSPAPPIQRTLTRLTFDDGLQIDASWSPDGRFLAYSSDRGGKFDIWVQQVSGGDPVPITKGPGHHWQPDWSHDGRYIAYRSENDEATAEMRHQRRAVLSLYRPAHTLEKVLGTMRICPRESVRIGLSFRNAEHDLNHRPAACERERRVHRYHESLRSA